MKSSLLSDVTVHTVEDYLRTPDGPPWFELIDGQLVQEPSPTSGHQSVITELVGVLFNYFKASPGGRVFAAPLDVYLGAASVLQPDIAVVLQARQRLISTRGIEGPPDLVIEVLSPSNRRLDRGPKRLIYQREGVRALWLIDLQNRTVESVHFDEQRLESGVRIWNQGEVVNESILPGFTVSVAEIFQHVADVPG